MGLYYRFASLATISSFVLATSAASSLYLLPQPEISIQMVREAGAQKAQVVLDHWLGLDRLDNAHGVTVQDDLKLDVSSVFGSRKNERTMLLAVETAHATDIVPDGLMTTYTLTGALPPVSALAATYAQKAGAVFGARSVFTSASTLEVPNRVLDVISETEPAFARQFAALEAFVDGADSVAGFGAFELTGLDALNADARAAVRAAMQSALSQSIRMAFVVTSPSASALVETTTMQPPQQPLPPSLPPSQPIFSSGTCHATVDACTNATDSCSGRGSCASAKRAGKECFVCACGKTSDSHGRTVQWVGERCEKKDVSTTFVLLTGTTLAITLIAGVAVALLASVGSVELPNVLTSLSGIPAQRH